MEIPKFIKGVAKYFTYASDSGEATPTTQADLQELMKNNNTILECLVDGLWQPEKEMQLNQIIRSPNMPANMVAKVTAVGTTGTIEPEWTEMPDTSVSDGSVTFIMCPLLFSITTQAEAEAGTNNTKIMTPLRTKQLIKISLPSIATQAEAEAGTNNTKMMTPLRVYQSIGKLAITIPVGTGIDFYADSPPTGFLVRNGAAVSRTTYAALFAVIGTKYGAGNGSTTFNLPNSIGRFSEGGSTAGTVKNAGLPNIIGSFFASSRSQYPSVSGAFTTSDYGSNRNGENGNTGDLKYTFTASNYNGIYGASNTVQPPALTVLPCIKY